MSNKKKTLGILTFVVSLFSLTSCDTEMIQERIAYTVNNMLPNLWITLLQLGLFILVAILFIVIAYKPLKKKLNERASYIEKNIKDSEEKAQKAEDKIKEANEIVLKGQKKAGEIIQRAEKTAENKASELEKQLAETIEKQKQSAHNDIEHLHIISSYTLLYNASLMVEDGLGYAICFDKLINTTGDSSLCFRPLSPHIEVPYYFIWKKYK